MRYTNKLFKENPSKFQEVFSKLTGCQHKVIGICEGFAITMEEVSPIEFNYKRLNQLCSEALKND